MAEATQVQILDRASNNFLCHIAYQCELGLVGYDACFTRKRSRVRFSELVLIRMQLVCAISSVVRIRRCQRCDPGSIPRMTHIYFHTTHTYAYNNNNMLDPGFEPGLPRPQRGVLTSRLIELRMEIPGFDPGASRLQSARSSN